MLGSGFSVKVLVRVRIWAIMLIFSLGQSDWGHFDLIIYHHLMIY